MPTTKLRSSRAAGKSTGLLILAVAYYRMSSDKQDKSIDEQKVEVRKWASTNSYKIVGEYVEPGISGDDTAGRKVFQRMMQDAESGEFQAVVSWDQDRFGRFDTVESGFWIHPLRQNGIHLATVRQGVVDWNSSSGRLIYNIQQESKHQFLHDLAHNTTRGMVAKARRGEWVSGPVPLGYGLKFSDTAKRAGGRLVLSSKTEVETVLKIFDLYDSGLSLRGVRNEMNKQSRHPRTGRPWSESSIRTILDNPTYCGDFVWPRRTVGKYTQATHMAGEQIQIEDNHPHIITREQFTKTQSRLAANRVRTTPITNGGGYLLSGLLFCKSCGRKMFGWKNGDRLLYRCSGYEKVGSSVCDRNLVRQDEILTEVLAALESWATNPTTLEMLSGEIANLVQDATSGDSVEILTRRLAAVDQKLARAEERILIVDDDLVGTIQNMVRELRTERKGIESALKTARVPARSIHDAQAAHVSAAMLAVSNLRGVIAASNPAAVQTMLRELIDRIDVTVSKSETGGRFKYTIHSGEISFINPIQLAPRSRERHTSYRKTVTIAFMA